MRTLIFIAVLLMAGIAQAQVTHTFTVIWQDNSSNEEGFFVYRDGAKIAQTGVNVQSLMNTVTGAGGQQYCYQVSAFNHSSTGALQESARAGPACGVIPTPSQPTPNAPSNVQVSAISSSEIRVGWQDNSDNEKGFRVTRTAMQGGQGPSLILLAQNVTSYRDTGLHKNWTYCYGVEAFNDAGYSAAGDRSCAKVK